MAIPIEGDLIPSDVWIDTGVRRRVDASAPRGTPLLEDLEELRGGLALERGRAARRALDEVDELLAGLRALEPACVEDVERALAPVRGALRALAEGRPRLRSGSPRDAALLFARLRAVIGRSAEGGPGTSQLAVRYVRGDLSALIAPITAAVSALAAERGLELRVRCPRRLRAEVDPDHFTRILLGLLVAAFRGAAPGAVIALRMEAHPEEVELTVSSVALAPADLAPRRDRSGLAAVAERVALLGGSLCVTRSALGGSRLSATLPRRAPAGVEVTVAGPCVDLADELAAAAAAIETPPAQAADPSLAARAHRAKRDFLGMVSHELKTPVTAMRLHLRMLERESGPSLSPLVRSRLERIHRSKHRLLFVIETMLECSRHEDGRLAPHARSFDARSFVAAVVDELRDAGAATRLRLAPPVAPHEPELATDARLLRLILLNVLTLALDRGGDATVELSVDPSARAHRFRIGHGGRAFSAAEERELLAPLEVELDLRARSGSGSGLGLFLVNDLAKVIGGRVSIRSPSRIEVSVPWLAVGAGSAE